MVGGTHGKKGRIPLRNLCFRKSSVDTNEGSLGNGKKGFIRGYDFCDKGGMDGWGAKWKNKIFSAYKFPGW